MFYSSNDSQINNHYIIITNIKFVIKKYKFISNKDLTFIANPYISNKEDLLDCKINNKDSESYKKLFILYNLRWRQKDCYWSESVIDYLNSISNTKLDNLYKVLINSSIEVLGLDTGIVKKLKQIFIYK